MATCGLNVLIADDDRPFTLLARSYLEGSGFEVVGVVHDGQQAVEACRRRQPDVILLDINMPRLDGLSVARRLVHEAPATTLIILSSMGEAELVEQAIHLGITHYHVKPISRAAPRVHPDRGCRGSEAQGRRAELSERKLVERAKGLLMDRNGLSEADAYRFLRSESQNRRIAIHNLAEMLLIAEEMQVIT